VQANGEVSWPDDRAGSAIEALTATGHIVLGLDVRFYFADGTFYEIPWSSFGPPTHFFFADGTSREVPWDISEADVQAAMAHALDALSRIDELERPENAVERRVLVTWRENA
jgi:hypothetical protein